MFSLRELAEVTVEQSQIPGEMDACLWAECFKRCLQSLQVGIHGWQVAAVEVGLCRPKFNPTRARAVLESIRAQQSDASVVVLSLHSCVAFFGSDHPRLCIDSKIAGPKVCSPVGQLWLPCLVQQTTQRTCVVRRSAEKFLVRKHSLVEVAMVGVVAACD